jgi:hypothetical protein
MENKQESAADLNGTLWVLFKSTGKDQFQYKEVHSEGNRAIPVFTSHEKASLFASRYASEYKAITLENAELWSDFLKRRAREGVGYVMLDPFEPNAVAPVQTIGQYIQSIER